MSRGPRDTQLRAAWGFVGGNTNAPESRPMPFTVIYRLYTCYSAQRNGAVWVVGALLELLRMAQGPPKNEETSRSGRSVPDLSVPPQPRPTGGLRAGHQRDGGIADARPRQAQVMRQEGGEGGRRACDALWEQESPTRRRARSRTDRQPCVGKGRRGG